MAKLPGAIQSAGIVGERYASARRRANPEGRMPLFDHLRELRNRIVKAALALVAGMIAGFVLFEPAWRVIERPLCHATVSGHSGCAAPGVNQLILNSPLDPFRLRVKVAFIVGIIVSSPVWLYQLWAFIAPGLYAREQRWGRIFLGTAVPLFLTGNVLAYLTMGGFCLDPTSGGSSTAGDLRPGAMPPRACDACPAPATPAPPSAPAPRIRHGCRLHVAGTA